MTIKISFTWNPKPTTSTSSTRQSSRYNMGIIWSDIFDGPVEHHIREYKQLKKTLIELMQYLTPESVLELAVEDKDICELCREIPSLRESCILGALRKYHQKKNFEEDVHKRTADFMVLLDNLVKIQEEEDYKATQKALKKQRFIRNLLNLLSCKCGNFCAKKNTEENENED